MARVAQPVFSLEKYLAARENSTPSGTIGVLGVAIGKVPVELKPTDVVVVLEGGSITPEYYTPKSGKNQGKPMCRATFASTGFGAIPVKLTEELVPSLRISMALPAVPQKAL